MGKIYEIKSTTYKSMVGHSIEKGKREKMIVNQKWGKERLVDGAGRIYERIDG